MTLDSLVVTHLGRLFLGSLSRSCFTQLTHSFIWRPSRIADTPSLVPIFRYSHSLFVADVSLIYEVLRPGGSWSSSGV